MSSDGTTGVITFAAWTFADRRAAGLEGWELFECPDSDDGPLQLPALVDGPDD